MRILQVHIADNLARRAISTVCNRYHDGRIKQKTLDFYRQNYYEKIKTGLSVVFVIGLKDSGLIPGLSACVIGRKTNKVIHSMTITNKLFREKGIGKSLLRTKLQILANWYPEAYFKTFVNTKNGAAISLCNSGALTITAEKSRKRIKNDKEEILTYYKFE